MISIKIPIPEKVSANKIYSGLHWSKRKKLADLYHKYFITYRKVKIDVEYPVDIEFKFVFKGRALDASNTFFMCKMIEDSLVQHEVLRGDTPKDVAFITVSSRKGKQDEVEIIIS